MLPDANTVWPKSQFTLKGMITFKKTVSKNRLSRIFLKSELFYDHLQKTYLLGCPISSCCFCSMNNLKPEKIECWLHVRTIVKPVIFSILLRLRGLPSLTGCKNLFCAFCYSLQSITAEFENLATLENI